MSTRASITLAEFGSKLRAMGPVLDKAVRRGLHEGAMLLVVQIHEEIASTTPHKPVDTGDMAAHYRAKRTAKGSIVGNTRPQALWIEVGRRPGPVSAEGRKNLTEWVRRKRLYLDALPKGAGKRPGRDVVQAACESVAFAIAKRLSEKGYAPRFPVKRALGHSRGKILNVILENMRQVRP